MRKVIGIGETILDIIFKNDQPTAAVPGGSAFNGIISLGRAGVPCTFISETGDDHVGEMIRRYMTINGVDASNVQVIADAKSPVSLAFLNEQNDANYIFFKDHPKDKLENTFPEINADDIVIFGSFYAINPVIRKQFKAFLDYAVSSGAILYYDINYRKSHIQDLPLVLDNIKENIAMVDIFRGSTEDFNHMLGTTDASAVYEQNIAPSCDLMLCTDAGADVMLFSPKFRKTYEVSPIETVSTIGAGDNFNAGVVYGLLKNNVRKADLPHLDELTWNRIIASGLMFAANVCQSVNNSIDEKLAKALKSDAS